MPRFVFNPFTGNLDVVPTGLTELGDVSPSVLPTQGSFLVGDGTVFQEFGVGADDQILVADSGEPTGVRWTDQDQLVHTSGESLVLGEVLTINTSGDVVKAGSDYSTGFYEVVHVALEAVPASNPVKVASTGETVPILFSSPPAASNNGSYVYLSVDPGKATLTPTFSSGNVLFIVGVLQGADGLTSTPDVTFQPQYITRRP